MKSTVLFFLQNRSRFNHGDDEKGCFNCEEFWCGEKIGDCFYSTQRCDGDVHCPNGKDEEDCSMIGVSKANQREHKIVN